MLKTVSREIRLKSRPVGIPTEENFELVVVVIIFVSIVPMVIEYVRGRANKVSGESLTSSQK